MIIIIILIIITFFNKIISKHYYLFNWYCDNFYDFKNVLSENELKYIYNIFNHSPIEVLNKTMDGKRLSYITFSHIIKDDIINSSRFSIGSIMLPNLSLNYALDILKDRNIILPKYLLSDDYKFGGLGWDLDNDYFKVYFRCLNKNFFYIHKNIYLNCRNKKIFKKIQNEYKSNKYWKEGILSFTYKNNKLYEKKIYVYPKYNKKYLTTYMLSNIRGIIKQNDINNYNTNDKIEKKLIEKYNNRNFKLDTVSMSKEGKVFYFPK